MSIIGIDTLVYGVGDVAESARFFEDFGLPRDAAEPDGAVGFTLPEGSRVVIRHRDDPALLASSRYPSFLKARIGGRFGHLSNAVAAELLGACRTASLGRVVAAHLSRENNSPALVREALGPVWSTEPEDLVVADAENGFGWLAVG